MGDSFAERSPTKDINAKIVDQHDVNARSKSYERSHEVHKDQGTQGHDDYTKQDVLQLLRGKLDRGEHLQDSEQLLLQALAKNAANKVHTDTQEQSHPSEEQPRLSEQPRLLSQQKQFPKEIQKPQWFENAPKTDTALLSKDTQELLNKIGGNIPAPPFINDWQRNDAAGNKPLGKQDAGDDQKSFEQDQRDEERRLYEMFQGDTHHVKGDTNEGDGKLLDKEHEEYGDKNEDDYEEEKDGQDDGGNADNDNYNEKDEDYMYGDQKHQVKPAEQVDNALI